jgi:hypothetical protein
MSRWAAVVAILVPLLTTGCSEPQVVVEAALTNASSERVPMSDLPIRLLPYDRDAIFDSLTQAYPQPEPPVPPELQAQQQQTLEAQQALTTAQNRRDALQKERETITARLAQLRGEGQQTSPQYQRDQTRLNALAAQERSAQAQVDSASVRVKQLQQLIQVALDSVRVQRERWADEAFAGFNEIVAAKLQAEGREEVADTTDAQGFARFGVDEGKWWVYARYTLLNEELYWNVPIEATGDSTYVALTRDNAEARPIF